ncbi:MAG TPA: DUF4062 domain-containing protein [Verrucomicrobiota bacterium]|jgi:hypothetical protein|nr:DUF4062 domain-containing protein [Verrucomicrobiota bacterium]
MAKVYISSTVEDLRNERRAASDWLISAGHQPVHSYVADSETIRDSCLDDIAGCDLYLLLLGHRYGYVPEADNPEGLSITHLEFRRAGELNLQRIALQRTSVPDIRFTDLLDPIRNQRLQAFHAEVQKTVRPAEFKDEADLIAALSTGVQRALAAPAGRGSGKTEPSPTLSAPGSNTLPPNHAGSPERSNWWVTLPGLLTSAAAVITAITGLVALFVTRGETQPAPQPAPSIQSNPAPATPSTISTTAPAPPTGAQGLPRVSLAGSGEVSFQQYRPSTYTVLGLETINRTPEHYGLRVRMRLLTRSSMDMNFWDSSFRLLVDGLPVAPDSYLNELVPGNAAKDADITFPVPMGAHKLVLRIIHHESLGETADLPLRIEGN